MNFGENLREEMSRQEITQQELADKTGVSKRSIEAYVRKDNPTTPSVDFAYRIARALNVTVEYLVTGEDKRQSAVTSLKKKRLEEQLMAGLRQVVHKTVEGWG